MPKQIGPHQLRGKMNNVCYYQQKGMQTGLARRINPNMGDRLKTEDVFSNVRTANSFFGACSIVAKLILDMTGVRVNYLHKFDRQAILTKGVYNASQQMGDTISKSEIRLQNGYYKILPNEYSKIAKNDLRSHFGDIPVDFGIIENNIQQTLVINEIDLDNYCRQYNAIGVHFIAISNCYIYSLSRDEEINKFTYPEHGQSSRGVSQNYFLGEGDIEIPFLINSPDDAMTFAILIAQPIKRMQSGRAVTMRTGSGCCMIGYKIQA